MTPRSASALALLALALPAPAHSALAQVDKLLIERFKAPQQNHADWTIYEAAPKAGEIRLQYAEAFKIYYGVLKNPPSESARYAVMLQIAAASPLANNTLPLFVDGDTRGGQAIFLSDSRPSANGNGGFVNIRSNLLFNGEQPSKPVFVDVPDGQNVDWNALSTFRGSGPTGRVLTLPTRGGDNVLTINPDNRFVVNPDSPILVLPQDRDQLPVIDLANRGQRSSPFGLVGAPGTHRVMLVPDAGGQMLVADPTTPQGRLILTSYLRANPGATGDVMKGLGLDKPAAGANLRVLNVGSGGQAYDPTTLLGGRGGSDAWSYNPLQAFPTTGGRTPNPFEAFLNPGGRRNPLLFLGNQEPELTFYNSAESYRPTLTDYVYDPKAKALVSKTSPMIAVVEVGNRTGTFKTDTLVVADGKFEIKDMTLRTAGQTTVRPEEARGVTVKDLAPTLSPYTGWKTLVTPLADWRAGVKGAIMTSGPIEMQCYHPKLSEAKTLLKALEAGRAQSKVAICVQWNSIPPDRTATSEGKKYRIREYVKALVVKVGIKDGKLHTDGGYDITEGDLDKSSFEDATHVKVQEKDAPKPAPAVVELSGESGTGELRWLTREEQAAYAAAVTAARAAAQQKGEDINAALKLVIDQYRAKAAANMRDADRAVYEPLWKVTPDGVPDAAKLAAAVKNFKMWGHKDGADAKAPMEPHGPNAELQLSKAQYDEIAKTDKLTDYLAARVGISGAPPGKPEEFDPVALRKTLVEFKKAAGIAEAPAGTPAGEQPKPEISKAPLTPEEVALLTPNEARQYKAAVDAATINGKLNPEDPNLQRYAQALRKRIQDDKRASPYDPAKAPTTQAEFDALPDHAKRQFCEPILNAPATATAPKLEGDALQQARTCSAAGGQCGDAQDGRTGVTVHQHGPTTQTAGAWDAKKACQGLPQEPNLDVGGGPTPGDTGPGTGNNGVAANLTNGEDKEKSKGEQNPLTKPSHLYNGAKGALLGFLIGSFLGPVGMIAGALIGAAVFYGISLGVDKLDGKK